MTAPNTPPPVSIDAATLARILGLAHIGVGVMQAQHALNPQDLRAVQVAEAVVSAMLGEKGEQ